MRSISLHSWRSFLTQSWWRAVGWFKGAWTRVRDSLDLFGRRAGSEAPAGETRHERKMRRKRILREMGVRKVA